MDTASSIRLNIALLKATYGLTEAEIKVAEQIVQGGSLAEVAQQLEVSANTIKTQFAQSYGKIDTHNHGKLIKF